MTTYNQYRGVIAIMRRAAGQCWHGRVQNQDR
jgi:hypothetical protein